MNAASSSGLSPRWSPERWVQAQGALPLHLSDESRSDTIMKRWVADGAVIPARFTIAALEAFMRLPASLPAWPALLRDCFSSPLRQVRGASGSRSTSALGVGVNASRHPGHRADGTHHGLEL